MYNCEYENDGEMLIKVKDIPKMLDYAISMGIENGTGSETIDYLKKENELLLEKIKDLDKEELMCLYINAMNGWFMINNRRISDLLEEMKEIKEKEKNNE